MIINKVHSAFLSIIRESEAQVEKWLNKQMVESWEQASMGIQNKAFNDDEYIRADELMHRLCAPKDQEQMKSFILWTKNSPTDNEPTWNKVVCAKCYVRLISHINCDTNQGAFTLDVPYRLSQA
jgi:hypothetical protein